MRFGLTRIFAAMTAIFAILSVTFAQSGGNSGFDVSRMDTSADACDDFFQYTNGNWLKRTEIPPAYSRWGTFNILADNNQNSLKQILDDLAQDKTLKKGDEMTMVADFYASCMDEAGIEAAGTTPIAPYFKEIDGIKDVKSLQKTIANFHKTGVPALFGFSSSPDVKNSTMTIATTGQGGLSLPNKDYYTKTDEKSVEIREKFKMHVANMFKLDGADEQTAKMSGETVLALQTRLANASKAPVELRDPDANYNKKSVAELQQITPNFIWADYLKERGAMNVTEVNVRQPKFLEEVNKMLTDVSLNDWKVYLKWGVLNASAGRLPKKFVDESFDFYARTLQGTKEQQPRWKRCVGATDNALGEALGKGFVKKNFSPEAKARMSALIDNLFVAFKERLLKLDWMGDETKQKALEKLAAFKRKIGFNENPRGYVGLKIGRDSYFKNVSNVSQFEIARNLQDIGKPVDKTRWGMTPPTVNAYYNALFNEIVFPAGILQPPFFNEKADDAVNYGAIGAVIGHEITHGFDDQGSKYAADGNLKMWWTPNDRQLFEEKASCVADQFTGYEVVPSVFINGRLTLGENIADLGGLTVAYTAYENSLKGKPRPANIDGFTPEQRFFLGYAQVWSSKSTPQAERSQVLGDPHSAARYRVDGPLSNLPMFAEAFGCKTGDKMIRTKLCKIW